MAAALLCGAAAPWQAEAHPHVFAEARLEVVIAPDRTVTALRHVWRFDDVFASTVLFEFDKNQDMKLDDSELEEVGKTVHDSLAEFNYFQLVTHDGKDVAMIAPDRLMANFRDGQLVILFETHPKEPIRLTGKIEFGVYDPTFYTAIEFADDADMHSDGLPPQCARTVIRPDPDEAIAQNQGNLTEAFFNDPAGNDLSKIIATKLELQCKG